LRWILEAGGSEYQLLTIELCQVAGMGVNIMEVYPFGCCYLKGVYNAL
jgi:hypothetical protein